MRQHQPDQQRLLLAGGGVAGRHVLWREDHLQIGEMRTVERTACRSVPRAAVAQYLPVAILHRGGGLAEQRVFHPAVEHDLRGRKRGSFSPRAQHRREFCRGLAARRRHRNREFGGFALDRVAPMVVIVAHFQEAVARA